MTDHVEQTRAPEAFHQAAPSILATEHWSVLGLRSMAYSEAFSRATVFLNVLSASVVALALVADATQFGDAFGKFALVLFPLVLFLGVATYLRLVQLNEEDVLQVMAMNRLRRAYLDIAPELEPYFTSSAYDDFAGVMQTLTWREMPEVRPGLHMFITTPTVIATIDAIVAAAGAALITTRENFGDGAVIGISVAVFVLAWLGLMAVQFATVPRLRAVVPRFPTPDA